MRTGLRAYKRAVLLFTALLSLAGIAHAAEFSEGQVWAYKTRPGEEQSTLLINKIESHPRIGKIFHISVSGLKVRNPREVGSVISELPHFAVSQVTLEKSATKMIGTSKPNTHYLAGYKEWKRAFDERRAGIFTLSVAEIIEGTETSINRK